MHYIAGNDIVSERYMNMRFLYQPQVSKTETAVV
jgi:hypothetical protein